MNQQILKLASSCFPRDGDGNIHATPEIIAKFAELIVLECAEVSFKHWEKHKGCSAHFSIREHFGVE